MIEDVVVEFFDHIKDAPVEAQGSPDRPAGIGSQPAYARFAAGEPLRARDSWKRISSRQLSLRMPAISSASL